MKQRTQKTKVQLLSSPKIQHKELSLNSGETDDQIFIIDYLLYFLLLVTTY